MTLYQVCFDWYEILLFSPYFPLPLQNVTGSTTELRHNFTENFLEWETPIFVQVIHKQEFHVISNAIPVV